jgi:hypothetical protein
VFRLPVSLFRRAKANYYYGQLQVVRELKQALD